jgi:hypothetical protein
MGDDGVADSMPGAPIGPLGLDLPAEEE